MDIFYENVLYSQIDETSVKLRVALVEELTFDELFELRHNKGRNRMMREGADKCRERIDKLSRGECRIYTHYCGDYGMEMDESLILATGVQIEEEEWVDAHLKEREYPFYAFISHEHGGADEKWARWLQRRLENYRIPAEVVSKLRQEEETATPRTDPIPERFNVGAVADSSLRGPARYLIVICSPRGARSSRVNDDARHFTASGREEYIVPFIIDGEPDGEGEKRCYPAPLSTDLLGVSLFDGTREEAFFRVMARLLRVKFFRLYQRHLREQRRFMVRALAAATVVLSVLFVLTLWVVSAEITAARRSEESDGLVRFLTENIRDDERLPSGVRSMIDEKIRGYYEIHEKREKQGAVSPLEEVEG
jgi:hypothetical protein